MLLDAGKLRVRQSQTLGETVLTTTKQKTRYTIELPPSAIEVIRWHMRTQLETPEQQDSNLLFPSVTGGFRAPTVLNKPFATVSDAIRLGYHFTQRGMRRTFNDLMRAAEVEASSRGASQAISPSACRTTTAPSAAPSSAPASLRSSP